MNIIVEVKPCANFIPVSPAKTKRAESATPTMVLTNRMNRKRKIRIPEDCLRFSVNKLSFIVMILTSLNRRFAAKIQFL